MSSIHTNRQLAGCCRMSFGKLWRTDRKWRKSERGPRRRKELCLGKDLLWTGSKNKKGLIVQLKTQRHSVGAIFDLHMETWPSGMQKFWWLWAARARSDGKQFMKSMLNAPAALLYLSTVAQSKSCLCSCDGP